MDLSPYYEDFQSIFPMAICTVILAFFAVIFVGVRAIKDKKESKISKTMECIMLVLIFALVLYGFITYACTAKMDLEERTIYYYEGVFQITDCPDGLFDAKAVFLFEDQEITLQYPFGESKYNAIAPGKYVGKFVYAYHLEYLLEFEIYESCVD